MTKSSTTFPLTPLFLAMAIAATFTFWWILGRPVAIPDMSSSKIACASFAPYLPGQTPFDLTATIPPEAIDADLRLLSSRFDCVRTYAVNQGLQDVPRLARAHGMKVLLGAWIAGDPIANSIQVERALIIAKTYPDVVRAIVVGNETILRGDLSASRLSEILHDVHQRSTVPITYADVWEFWLRNPELAKDVDFITIHILPFWEDEPMNVDDALAHVETVLAKVKLAFPDKRILIGEVGWPSAGRMRGPAEPGRVNQAKFIRQFVTMADTKKIDYNLIESLDQPWKQALEGTVGGHWGIFDVDRKSKFAFTGPLSEFPHWLTQFALSAMLGALPVLWLLLTVRRSVGIARAIAAQAAGTVLVLQAGQILTMATSTVHWLTGGAIMMASAATAWLLLTDVSPCPTPLIRLINWARGNAKQGQGLRPTLLGGLRGLAMFGAAMVTLGLAFDSRYRDFPVVMFLIPAIGFLRLRLSVAEAAEMVEESWLGAVLAMSTVAVLIQENIIANHQALAWITVALALALPGIQAGWINVRELRKPFSENLSSENELP